MLLLSFWCSVALILYTYIGYPLLLAGLRRLAPIPVRKGPLTPKVSVVMAARNEESNIVRRLQNLAAQTYPPELLEVIVVSDGSADKTVELVRSFTGIRVKCVVLDESVGKAEALNAGVTEATGEIIVFCDARQTFDVVAVAELVRNFFDVKVGGVSGELFFHTTGEGIQAQVGGYWRYEKWIRRAESACGSAIGGTGAIFAMRKSLYRDLPPGTLLDDVMTPMNVVLQGYRTIVDGSARAYDIASAQVSQEWVRKVRTLAGNWQLISLAPSLLSPFNNPCCWRFVSHKVLRLLVPAALVVLAVSGALLEGPFYRVFTAIEGVFYALAALGGAVPITRSNRWVNSSYFFLVMNLAAAAGFWCWATGKSGGVWQPAYGSKAT